MDPWVILILLVIWSGFVFRSQEAFADEGGPTMKIVRIYTGPDNQSHFEDIEVPLKDGGKTGFISELIRATGVVFRLTAGDSTMTFTLRRGGNMW